jgi:hypothetical protein
MFRLESNDGAVILSSGKKCLRIAYVTQGIARITSEAISIHFPPGVRVDEHA